MNNDFYNPDQLQQYESPLPMYGEVAPEAQIADLTDQAFSKGLAAAIMGQFPVASIIAIFYGNKAQKLVAEARAVAESTARPAPKKLTAAKVLGKVGKICGIVSTAVYGVYALWAIVYLAFIIILALSTGRSF